MTYTAKIEQTPAYLKRMRYMPGTDSFEEKDCDSLSYIRNVPEPSGWIKESGTPPCEHLDVIVMTDIPRELGDIAKFRFHGSSGGVSKFVIQPEGKTTAEYINRAVTDI